MQYCLLLLILKGVGRRVNIALSILLVANTPNSTLTRLAINNNSIISRVGLVWSSTRIHTIATHFQWCYLSQAWQARLRNPPQNIHWKYKVSMPQLRQLEEPFGTILMSAHFKKGWSKTSYPTNPMFYHRLHMTPRNLKN